jgi:NAD(P)-dependent dehydrogenase (short-subunit alcohol dehydrogenase family)
MVTLYTGIGSGVARAFARDGCMRIAITDLNAELLKQTRDTIVEAHPEVQVYAEAGDISNASFTTKFFENVAKELGRIDYAVNCAGVLGNNQRSTETSPEEFDSVNNVNYRGCWLSSRAELHQMLQQSPLPSHDPARPPQRGSIVNIASQLGIVSRPCARKS